MKGKIIYLFLLICMPLSVLAENASNVRVMQQGKDIIINYDLDKTSYVRLLLSNNNSKFELLTATEGDVQKRVNAGKDHTIVWHPLEENENFIADNVRFKVETISPYEYYSMPYFEGGETNIETYILAELATSFTPHPSYGFMFGQTYQYGLGWFVDLHSSFNFMTATNGLKCGKGGYVDGELPFYSGRKRANIFTAHAGFVVDFLDVASFSRNRFSTIGLYAGLGYGWHRVFLETTTGQWIEYGPASFTGFSANMGLMGSIYGATLRLGVNTINFKYSELEIGLGWMF